MALNQTKPIEENSNREAQLPDRNWQGKSAAEQDRLKHLRIALQLVGVAFIFGIYIFVLVWPSGWSWHAGHSHSLPHYLQMILGVYATLGVFLLIASRNPLQHLSLIWFTVWSSVVHAGIMAAQALANPQQIAHLWGDVPVLLVMAGVLALLTPRTAKADSVARAKIATATAIR